MRLESFAYELNEWLEERGLTLYREGELGMSDGHTFLELGDIRSFNHIKEL